MVLWLVNEPLWHPGTNCGGGGGANESSWRSGGLTLTLMNLCGTLAQTAEEQEEEEQKEEEEEEEEEDEEEEEQKEEEPMSHCGRQVLKLGY